jgi:hypothetical protein
LQGGAVDGFENRVNLLVFQVIDGPLSRALKGNAEDALGQLDRKRQRKPSFPAVSLVMK